MKKISFLAFSILTLTSQVIASSADTFSTNITVQNGTSAQNAKIDSAETKIRNIIQSDEFKSRVINFTYNDSKKFVDNGGLTNTQIYNKIILGAEVLNKVIDHEMDLNIKTYYENSSTVGYTTTTSTYINMNTKFLNTYTVAETAKTMTHEWLHKLGFKHAVTYSTSRDYSVPYGVGRIIKELAAKY